MNGCITQNGISRVHLGAACRSTGPLETRLGIARHSVLPTLVAGIESLKRKTHPLKSAGS